MIDEGPEKCMSCGARYDLESDRDAWRERAEKAEALLRRLDVQVDSEQQLAYPPNAPIHRDHWCQAQQDIKTERDAALARVADLEKTFAEWWKTDPMARIAELEKMLKDAEEGSNAILIDDDGLRARITELERALSDVLWNAERTGAWLDATIVGHARAALIWFGHQVKAIDTPDAVQAVLDSAVLEKK